MSKPAPRRAAIRDDWRLEDRDDRGLFIPFTLPHEMPEAFVCNCDEVAYNLVETLKRNGYRVPQDVAVTGYDDYRYSTICSPQLTSYRVDLGRPWQKRWWRSCAAKWRISCRCPHRHRARRLCKKRIYLIKKGLLHKPSCSNPFTMVLF